MVTEINIMYLESFCPLKVMALFQQSDPLMLAQKLIFNFPIPPFHPCLPHLSLSPLSFSSGMKILSHLSSLHYLYSTRGLRLVSVLEALSRTPHSYELTSRRGSLLGIAWHARLLLGPRKNNKRAGPEITVLIFKKCIDK